MAGNRWGGPPAFPRKVMYVELETTRADRAGEPVDLRAEPVRQPIAANDPGCPKPCLRAEHRTSADLPGERD